MHTCHVEVQDLARNVSIIAEGDPTVTEGPVVRRVAFRYTL